MFNQEETTLIWINFINRYDIYFLQKAKQKRKAFYDPTHTLTFIIHMPQLTCELVGCVSH
jgi:hypothetical protein